MSFQNRKCLRILMKWFGFPDLIILLMDVNYNQIPACPGNEDDSQDCGWLLCVVTGCARTREAHIDNNIMVSKRSGGQSSTTAGNTATVVHRWLMWINDKEKVYIVFSRRWGGSLLSLPVTVESSTTVSEWAAIHPLVAGCSAAVWMDYGQRGL